MNSAAIEIKLDSIEQAIEDIKAGKIVIVVDDEERENEGDFVCAADKVTPELINFMAKYGRGLICTPISEERALEMGLNRMVNENTDLHGTAFTVSIDYKLKGCTTGISAYDRATGIKALLDEETKPSDFTRPGHIFPLISKPGGVLRRMGHTEASVDLARLAGLKPAGVLVEILKEDGSMARLPDLMEIAQFHGLSIVSIKDLVAFRMQKERLIKKGKSFPFETDFGKFELVEFHESGSDLTHIVLKKGEWNSEEPILTRVHSSTNAAELLSLLLKGEQHEYYKTMKRIQEEGKGLLVFLRQKEGENSFKESLDLLDQQQKSGEAIDFFPRNTEHKQRELGIGAQILFDMDVRKIRLLTKSIRKRVGLIGYSLEIVEEVPI